MRTLTSSSSGGECRNPNLRLVTKGRACKGAGQEWNSKITFHTLGNVGKCEGMNLHTPKWVPTLGVGVLMDSRIFRRWLQGSRLIALKSYLCHWKNLRTYMSKIGSHDLFGVLQAKVMAKRRVVSQIVNLTSDNKKSRIAPIYLLLKSFQQGLKLCFKPHFNRRSSQEVMGL
jgi:hypothetical protein